MKRFRGEEGYLAKQAYIKAVVEEHGVAYDGPVIFVPSAHQLAAMVEQSHGFFYCAPNEPYEEKIEKATGLTVIHKGGLVLVNTVKLVESQS